MSVLDNIAGIAARIPFLQKRLNRIAINRFVNKTKPRPRPFSLWSESQGTVSDYACWPTLTDRVFSGRHLPPAEQAYVDALPEDGPYKIDGSGNVEIGDVTELFKRTAQIDSSRSSVLFMFFAQWFTDSFLRIDGADRRKNTSNHEIDLCQIYGLKETTTNILRSHNLGKLKSQIIDGEEYPDYLYDANGEPKPEYKDLPYVDKLDELIWRKFPIDRKKHYYATGLERGNSTVGYTALSTLFLREHNKICDELHFKNPVWDDERIFQTARNILIVILLKIVVEQYINHISPFKAFPLKVDPTFPEQQKWYRTNWIALEFDLLYRWHSLVPNRITFKGTTYDPPQYMVNNALLEQVGIGTIFDEASSQAAGKIGLFNTPDFLLEAEYQSIKMTRTFRVKSFNDYREQFGLDKVRSFEELTDNVAVQNNLGELYGNMDNLEFLIGLFSEGGGRGSLFGELMTTMVAGDAFSQALTNPLLSMNIFNEDTFSKYGMELINDTSSLGDLVKRNVVSGENIKASLGL